MFDTYFKNCDYFSAIMQSTSGIFVETFNTFKQKANLDEIFSKGPTELEILLEKF